MGLSIWQLLIILLIVVLLFGAGKIPRLMGDVGKGIRSFRSGLKESEEEAEDQEASRTLDRDRDATRADTATTTATTPRNDETARSS